MAPIVIPLVQPKLSEQLQQQAPTQAEVQPVPSTPDVFRVVHPNSAQVDLVGDFHPQFFKLLLQMIF
jgi:hypothetical protein